MTMSFSPYIRQVHYYETDQMAIVHHSNYIRWMEEARLDLLSQLGIPYHTLEQQGILIPVVDVSCRYLSPARYGDSVQVLPVLTEYTGVRMVFSYEIRLLDSDRLVATGTSTHCFTNPNQCVLSLRRKAPELHQLLLQLL